MRRSDKAMARRVGDEIVILDVDSGRYFGLNEVGAFIWDRIEPGVDRAELIAAVVAAYDVDTQQAEGDINDLLSDLTDRGLIDT